MVPVLEHQTLSECGELYAELNGLAEEADNQKRSVEAIMKNLGSVREIADSPSTTEAEKVKFSAAAEKMKPIVLESIDVSKEAQEKLENKVKMIAAETGKSTGDVLRTLVKYHRTATTAKVLKQLKFAQTLDILFVYDATGSMGPHIHIFTLTYVNVLVKFMLIIHILMHD